MGCTVAARCSTSPSERQPRPFANTIRL
jgi:hypothetical protein